MIKVSQKVIADKLGISQRAVSKALSGQTGVSADTRDKVRATARQLGYRSNRLARSLIDGETKIIGALTPGLSGLFLSQLFDAANSALAKRGYNLLISRWQRRHETDESEINVLLQYCVEGIITVPRTNMAWDATIYPELAAQGRKMVFVNQKFPGEGVCSVYSDDLSGSRTAVDFLLSQGHQHIACLELGSPFATSYQMRRQGYKQALRDAGIARRPEYVCDLTKQTLEVWLSQAINRFPEITAFFCFDDATALDAIRILSASGKRVPEDFAVVGYGNDIPYPEYMQTPLTTVNQSAEQIGTVAVQQLLKMLQGRQVEKEIVVPTRLVIRKSAPCRRAVHFA